MDAKGAKKSLKVWATNFYKSFSIAILLYMNGGLSKIISIHMYEVSYIHVFARHCISVIFQAIHYPIMFYIRADRIDNCLVLEMTILHSSQTKKGQKFLNQHGLKWILTFLSITFCSPKSDTLTLDMSNFCQQLTKEGNEELQFTPPELIQGTFILYYNDVMSLLYFHHAWFVPLGLVSEFHTNK